MFYETSFAGLHDNFRAVFQMPFAVGALFSCRSTFYNNNENPIKANTSQMQTVRNQSLYESLRP
jgi:hypothetical protein